MKIRRKLHISFISIAFLIAASLLSIMFFSTVTHFEQHEGNQLKENVIQSAKVIDNFMFSRVNELNILSNNPLFSISSNEIISDYLSRVVEQYTFYEHIFFIDKDAIIISSSSQGFIGLNIIDIEPDIKEEFHKTLIGGDDDVYISDIAKVSQKEIKEKSPLDIELLSNVIDLDGNVIGVLVGIVNIQLIRNVIYNIDNQTIGNEYAYLVNAHGDILISENPEINILQTHPDLLIKNLKQKLEGGENGFTIYHNSKGVKVISGYADLSEYGTDKTGDWSLLSTTPYDTIMNPIYQILFKGIIAFSFILIGIFILVFVISRSLSKPLIQLQKIVSTFNIDSKPIELIIGKNDEVQSLSESFNMMTKKLYETSEVRKHVEIELSESEEKFKSSFYSSPAAQAILSEDGNFVELNDVFAKLIGFTREQIIGNSAVDLGLLSLKERKKLATHAEASGGIIKNAEVKFKIKDGSFRYILYSIEPITLIGITHRLAIGIDITDRIKAEEEMLKTNERNELISSATNDALWDWDFNTNIVWWNQGVTELFGHKLENNEATPDWWVENIHPEEREKVEKFFFNLVNSDANFWEDEYRFRCNDGSYKHVYDRGIVRRDEQGKAFRMIGAMMDITERKQAEEKLKKEKDFLEAVFNSISEGIVACDANGILTRFNKATVDFHGIPKEAIPPDEWANYYNLYHSDGKTPMQKEDVPLYIALKDGAVKNAEFMIIPKNGTARTIVSSGQILKDAEGNILGAVAAMHDITDRKEMENALRESETYSRTLFDHAAVPIWVEDFSEVKKALDKLKDKGITDFNEYFSQNLDEVKRISAKLKFLDINVKSLEFYEADSKEELIQSLGDWFVDKSWLTFKDELVALANGKHSFEGEIPVVSPKGITKHLILNLSIHPDHYDSMKIVFVSFVDITDRKKAEEEMLKTNERNELISLATNDAIWDWDMNTNIVWWNQGVTELFGHELENNEATPDWWVENIHPEEREKVEKFFFNLVNSDANFWEDEYRFRCNDGSYKQVYDRGIVRRDEQGKAFRMLGAMMDITQRKQAEKALYENEELLRLSSELADVAAWEMDLIADSMTRSSNHDKLYGLTDVGQWHVNTFMDATHIDDREKCNRLINESLASGGSGQYQFDFRILYPDQSIHWLNVIGQVIERDSNGVGIKIRGFISDITVRKKAEELLEKERRENQTIIDTSPVMIAYRNKKDRFVKVNSAYANFVGLPIEEIIGKTTIDIVKQPEIAKRGRDHDQEVMKTGKPVLNKLVKLSGFQSKQEVWAIYSKLPFYDEDGNTVGTISFIQDIDDQKKAEEALSESESKLNALFTSLTEVVIMNELVLNDAGEAIDYRITDCNKVFTEVTGISKEDAIGKLASEVYQTDPPPFLEILAKVGLSGDPHEFTYFDEPLGKHFMTSVVSPQTGKFATITTDISDMMQIQERIIAKNKEMENYLYITSHDLRTPLVNIQGFSQRLKKQADSIKTLFADKALEPEILHQLAIVTDEDIPKTLSFVLGNIEKMDNLIKGLLQLSRTGRIEMNIEKIDMNALVAKIIQSLNFQVKEAQCEIHMNQLPECYGDGVLLDQLFSNIISNALKYSDSERALEITVDAKQTNNRVVYTIRDTGKGIAQKHLEKIWDVFYRIDPRSGKTGEGIGLSLVKRIAEKHKGKVWVESEENIGSVFYVELHNHSFTEF